MEILDFFHGIVHPVMLDFGMLPHPRQKSGDAFARASLAPL
jgi:hypothetical protein